MPPHGIRLILGSRVQRACEETVSTTTRPIGRGIATVPAITARAVLCAALAVVVVFSQDHGSNLSLTSEDRDPGFGLAVLGTFLIVQAVLFAVCSPGFALSRVGRLLVLARAAVSLVGGIVAFASVSGGLTALRQVEALVFLLLGVLEVVGGLRRTERPELAGDAVVVGGLQILVGLMVVILNADTVFSIGVLSAWGAVVAVYLGISAANLWRKARTR